jgi:hypothetical protein
VIDETKCKIKISGHITYEAEIPVSIAHQIIGIAIGGSSDLISLGSANIKPIALNEHPTLLTRGTTAKSFAASKRPSTDVEKVAVSAFYLTYQEATPHFKTVDLERVTTDAAIEISNFARAVDNATRQSKFLAKAGSGKKQITSLGEAIVNALPDREKVSAALKEGPARKKRKIKKKK